MKSSTHKPYVLSVAGFDPSGGAGVLADCKTMQVIGVQSLAALTANTLQTHSRLLQCHWMSEATILQQVRLLLETYPVRVVKIGIVPNLDVLQELLKLLRDCPDTPTIIWDPVVKASTGFSFLDMENLSEVLSRVLPQIDLLTPNYEEIRIFSSERTVETGIEVVTRYTRLLLKGGHRKEKGTDEFYEPGRAKKILQPHRGDCFPKHGSGCVLSSAIASYYALTEHWEKSCALAKAYTETLLASGDGLIGEHPLLKIENAVT